MLESIPFAYARHKLICNANGVPIDYVFVEVNERFELLTGLKASEILNKKVTEIIPDILFDTFNWIEFYGNVALGITKEQEFEQFSAPLNKWFKVNVISYEPMFFITFFTDVTAEYLIASLSKQLQNWNSETIDYKKIAETVCQISGARYASFNIFEKNGKDFTTVAIAGIQEHLQKAIRMLGFDLVGRKWPYDPVREHKIKESKTTFFISIADLSNTALPKTLSKIVENTFDVGEVVIIKTEKDSVMLGDFTLMFAKNTKLKNQALTESFVDIVGAALARIAAEKSLKIQEEELFDFFSVNLDLVCIADVEGNFIKVNKEWEHVLGYSVKELESRKFLDFVHPDDLQSTLDVMKELENQKQVLNFTNRYLRKDGSYRYFEWRSKPKGKFIYGAARDVTDNVKRE